jgi:hypothetical protein
MEANGEGAGKREDASEARGTAAPDEQDEEDKMVGAAVITGVSAIAEPILGVLEFYYNSLFRVLADSVL